MIVAFILLGAALAGAAASAVIWGFGPNIPLMTSVICAIAALVVLLREKDAARNWIVVDGSNVLYWDRDTPDIQSVVHVVGALASEGYVPVVWFDANVGYLIGDRYMGPAVLARTLGLPARQVFVAPRGTPADPLLLRRAVKSKARVVTNDRFRDWVDQFPQIREKGFLVQGKMRKDDFALALGE